MSMTRTSYQMNRKDYESPSWFMEFWNEYWFSKKIYLNTLEENTPRENIV